MKTLKDLETPDHNMPRVMTPENGVKHDHTKGEPKILDEKYILHVYSEQLREAAREHMKQMEIVLKRYDSNENEYAYLQGKIDWIKEFFNLEE